ncbi:MAG: AEC family transporter [Chitinivibrionales bacterium]|nr:AEC family transporter [Chitinivibrionales bacterium]
MVTDKILEVFRVAAPVFALLGIGKVLIKTGFMTNGHRDFLTRLTYTIALPALLLLAIAQQDVSRLFQPWLIAATVVPIILTAVVQFFIVSIVRLKGTLAAATIFCSFWGNTVYLGFPLCSSAFGMEQGLSIAAVINAFCTPIFVFFSILIISLYQHPADLHMGRIIFNSLYNPLIISIIAGLLASIGLHQLHHSFNPLPVWLRESGLLFKNILNLTGSMGLSCALIAMGGTLSLASFTNHRRLLLCTVAGKLVLSPLITILFISVFSISLGREYQGVLIILMAVPGAVASYVIARQLDIAAEFVTASVVVSTIASMGTIPVWLYLVLQ